MLEQFMSHRCRWPDLRHVTSTAAGCAPRPSRPSSRDVRKQLRHITSCSSSSECSTSYAQQIAQQPSIALPSPSRRATLSALLAATALSPLPAHASKLPAFADSAWEAMGGGPSDLFFPDDFVGVWDVTSTLVQVETPLGRDVLPNPRVVERAEKEDLDKPLTYQVAFVRNREAKVVYDRRFNTAALMKEYYGDSVDFTDRIVWDINDPNVLRLSLPKGFNIRTRVTRRSEEVPEQDRIETSEYIEQIYDESSSGTPRLKASQCFTKYKWRPLAQAQAAGGPAIVATQVVSDYLTPYDGEERYLRAMNKPVATYLYRMAFRKVEGQQQQQQQAQQQ